MNYGKEGGGGKRDLLRREPPQETIPTLWLRLRRMQNNSTFCCKNSTVVNKYSNQDLTDEFPRSLAEGGFQVGELAKVYYGIKGDADIDVLDYDERWRR